MSPYSSQNGHHCVQSIELILVPKINIFTKRFVLFHLLWSMTGWRSIHCYVWKWCPPEGILMRKFYRFQVLKVEKASSILLYFVLLWHLISAGQTLRRNTKIQFKKSSIHSCCHLVPQRRRIRVYAELGMAFWRDTISLIGVPSAHVRQLCLRTRMWKNNHHVRTRIFINYPVKIYKKEFFP